MLSFLLSSSICDMHTERETISRVLLTPTAFMKNQAWFTFSDTSFSSRGLNNCGSICDHFFCMRRSFLFCLTVRTHTHMHGRKHKRYPGPLLILFFFLINITQKTDTVFILFPMFGNQCFYLHYPHNCLPVEDESYGCNHDNADTQNDHDHILEVQPWGKKQAHAKINNEKRAIMK